MAQNFQRMARLWGEILRRRKTPGPEAATREQTLWYRNHSSLNKLPCLVILTHLFGACSTLLR